MTHMAPDIPPDKDLRTFNGLRRVVATLRAPDGCPWDRVQTHESLRPYLVEEAAEVVAALDEGDSDKLREELGDLLFQVLIQTQLAEEDKRFTMADVIHGIASKLVRRHPHVFADADASTPEAVVEQWDDLKKKERIGQSALAGIPDALPALAYSQAIQRRASKAGFAWESVDQVWEALDEELRELRETATPEERASEAGDALFALVNLVRHLDADAEDALRQTARRFARLFTSVETMACERDIDLKSTEMQTKLDLWEEAKGHAQEVPR